MKRRGLTAPFGRAVLALAFVVIWALLAPAGLPGAAGGAGAATVQAADAIVEFGDDVHIGPAEHVEAVVAFGGDVTVEGTVDNNVIAFGGNVDLRPGGSIGSGMSKNDHAIVTFGGQVNQAPGSTVLGKTLDVSDFDWGWARDVGEAAPFLSPFGFGSAFGWALGLVMWSVVGLVLVAVAPRQLKAVSSKLNARPAAYLGWGALEALVIFPLATILMVITIVGILVAVPWAIFVVPALFLFGYVAAAGIVGARILDSLGDRGGDLLLATIVGLAAFKVIDLVPILGSIALALVWLAGLGATVAALWDWQRNRRTGAPVSPQSPVTASESAQNRTEGAATAG